MRANSSIELLAHFEPDVASTVTRSASMRGVGWVLRWAAAIGVLFVAASILIEFAYCLDAEHTLARAARAGAVEATLPRASYQSVCASVERRLAGYRSSQDTLRVELEQNGVPVRGNLAVRGGDEFSVAVTVPAASVVPAWLRGVSVWRSESELTARAIEGVPGKELGRPQQSMAWADKSAR
jgi:hypothetical protein